MLIAFIEPINWLATQLEFVRQTQQKRQVFNLSFLLVHRKEFESLAFGSVDQRSIQLS